MISACASRRRVASTNAPTGLEGPRDRELAASLALPAPFHGAEQKNTLRVRVAARVCRVSDTCPGVRARRQSGVISCVCRVRRRRRRGRGPRCDCKRYFLWREARSASVGSLVPRLLQAGRSSSQLCGCCVIGRVSAGKGGGRRAGRTGRVFFLGGGRVVWCRTRRLWRASQSGWVCAVWAGWTSLWVWLCGEGSGVWLPESSALSDWRIISVTGIGTSIVPVSLCQSCGCPTRRRSQTGAMRPCYGRTGRGQVLPSWSCS